MALNELEAWFESLATDDKLLIVKRLLASVENDLDKLKNHQEPEPRIVEPELFDLDPPPMKWDDFDDLLAKDVKSESDDSVVQKRLTDATDRFRELLLRYGYIKRPPSFRELALKAYEEDKLLSFQNRKRPDWHEWVTKEDEEKIIREALELDD